MAILAHELRMVPPQNMILGGLSQGCAMSLSILLCLDHPIGGYIDMSGLPTYQKDLESAVAEETLDENDTFYDADRKQLPDRSVMAQSFERDLLAMENLKNPERGSTALSTPVFLDHGAVDEKVPLVSGEAAAMLVRGAGYRVTWKCYQEQGHWYKVPGKIDDIVDFIASRVGWEISDDGTR